jgi:hypothetical protein
MALFAEGDEVIRFVIGWVAISVMNVEILFSAAKPALVFIPYQNDFPELFPFFQTVFVPHGNDYQMTLTEKYIFPALSIGAGVAETAVCIFPGMSLQGGVPPVSNEDRLR